MEPEAAASDAPAAEAAQRQDLVLAVDAMSGEHGPEAALAAVAGAVSAVARARAIVFGDAAALSAHAARLGAAGAGRIELRNAESVVPMDAGPRDALRKGRGSSMWRALDAVGSGEADVAVSAGNTAALMAMASHRLRIAPNTPKPAIAALWPSRSAAGFNVVLDMGAGLEADAETLVGYALMGAAYARLALGLERPRIGLLNVGAERGKGRAELRAAADRLEDVTEWGVDARFVGFVEGDRIPSAEVDVVVTDGFTGNIALKTAEGTARLIGGYAREAFSGSWPRRAAALLAYPALKALRRRMDPRRVNGGVFLGLNGVVVKSHGAADSVAFASALRLATTIGRRDLARVVAAELAKLGREPQYRGAESPLEYRGASGPERAAGRLGKA